MDLKNTVKAFTVAAAHNAQPRWPGIGSEILDLRGEGERRARRWRERDTMEIVAERVLRVGLVDGRQRGGVKTASVRASAPAHNAQPR